MLLIAGPERITMMAEHSVGSFKYDQFNCEPRRNAYPILHTVVNVIGAVEFDNLMEAESGNRKDAASAYHSHYLSQGRAHNSGFRLLQNKTIA